MYRTRIVRTRVYHTNMITLICQEWVSTGMLQVIVKAHIKPQPQILDCSMPARVEPWYGTIIVTSALQKSIITPP